jgi:hypothetical protein
MFKILIILEGSRKLKNRCEYWVQSETLYVTNSFKKSIPVTQFLGIPECRQDQCLGSWELRAFMMTTQDMLCYMIRNMSANELSYFLMSSSSVSLANQGTDECYMNESCLKTRARCSCEYKRNEWDSLVCPSTVIYYCISLFFWDAMWSFCCGLFACEEAAQAWERLLTNDKKGSTPLLRCAQWRDDCVISAACGILHADLQETQGAGAEKQFSK